MGFSIPLHLLAQSATTPVAYLPNDVWDSLCKPEDWASSSLTSPMNVIRIALVLATAALLVSADRWRKQGELQAAQLRKYWAFGIGALAAGALFVPPQVLGELFNKRFCAKPAFEEVLQFVRVGLPIAAALLLILQARARRLGEGVSKKVEKRVAIALTVVAFFAYFDFFNPITRYREYYHRHEFYHYYLGSKYFKEINYTRLYECTLVAESELGRIESVRKREFRDLSRNLITPVTKSYILTEPQRCKQHFAPDRWEAFKKDVDWFYRSAAGEYWENMQKDHGYNPPPVWTMAGKFFADLAPAGDRFFKLLTTIDIGLQAGVVLLLGWAFGFRVMAIATVFWGCNAPANFYWTGGAFMRQDWIFFLVASVCLARKQKYALSGAALTWSALLRVFPMILFAGPLLIIVLTAFHRYRRHKANTSSGISSKLDLNWLIPSAYRRFVLGSAVAGVVLVGASLSVGGLKTYQEFASHISVHKNTPLTNHMGLETVLSHSWEGKMRFARDDNLDDPFEGWKNGRLQQFASLKPIAYALIGLAVLWLAWDLRRTRLLWVAVPLSVPLVILLLNLTCYYYSMFLLVGVLARLRPQLMPAFLAVSSASQLLLREYYWFDDKFTALSWLFVIFSFVLLFAYARPFTLERLKAFLNGKPDPKPKSDVEPKGLPQEAAVRPS